MLDHLKYHGLYSPIEVVIFCALVGCLNVREDGFADSRTQ